MALRRDGGQFGSIVQDEDSGPSHDASLAVGECSICLEKILTTQRRSEPPAGCSCRHTFHWPCLEQSLVFSTACPNCRHPLEHSGVLEIDPEKGTLLLHTPRPIATASDDEETDESSSWETASDVTEGSASDEGPVVQPNPLHDPGTDTRDGGQSRPVVQHVGGSDSATVVAAHQVLVACGIFLVPVGILAFVATFMLSSAEHRVQANEHKVADQESQPWTNTKSNFAENQSNCTGTWSRCNDACHRTWHESTPQLGGGEACPAPKGCRPGDDECPHIPIDCDGVWSVCSLECRREWRLVQSPAFGGAGCPPEPDCVSGEDLCPPDVDCVIHWSECSDACETSNERNGTLIVEHARYGEPCDTVAPDCVGGEGQCGRFPARPRSVWASENVRDLTRTTGISVQRIATLGADNIAAAMGGGDSSGNPRGRTDMRILAASPSFALILKADGRVYALGSPIASSVMVDRHPNPPLDQSMPPPLYMPVQINGADVRVRAVEAGAYHCVALTRSDDVLTWGHGERGQLGHGTFQSETRPRLIVANRVGSAVYGWRRSWIVAISAGGFHSAALTMEGRLYMWGAGDYFQLGTDSSRDESHPIEIMAVGSGNSLVALGRYHSLLLSGTGAVLAWGRDVEYQCGGGFHTRFGGHDTNPQPTTNQYCSGTVCVVTRPTRVFVRHHGILFNSTQIAVAKDSSFALTTSGHFFAWGANYQGQLGDGTTTHRSSPVLVVGYPADARQRLPVGGSQADHMLVLQHDGSFIGSGRSGDGQLGPDPLISWTDASGVTHRPGGSTLTARALPSLGNDNAQAARGSQRTLFVKM